MGFFDSFRRSRSVSAPSRSGRRKEITRSQDHDLQQVVNFKGTANDGSRPSEMGRELFSFPKPETKETMADYLSGHKDGDVFQYLAVMGKEDETKDSRLARLRAYTTPYGKEVVPEMRINGVVLDLSEGQLHIDDLKDHVNKRNISKAQIRENKHFKGISEHSFKKPYLQLRRVTGEYVPLLSGTADYTDLVFSLQDGRLLDHQIVVQSNKIPTNNNGVFELSCDYCIPTKDIKQLSIKYELARPIMKEGFQWGSVSLMISICESDTPYITPKVEAMAVVRAPFTAMEEHENDLDHKDVTYTSGQIKKFRELYTQGDVADVDEPKKERLKTSSYAKSSMRGAAKAQKGPDHLADLDGWSHLKNMKKPLMPEGVASVSAASGDDETEELPSAPNLDAWNAEQQKAREQFEEAMRSTSSSSSVPPSYKTKSPEPENIIRPFQSMVEDEVSDESEPDFIKRARKKRVSFNVHDV